MEHFLQNLLTASLHGSVVILAIILFRLISRKTPKKYICMLWLLAGIRLLLPIEIRSDLSLQPQFTIPFAKITSMKWAASIPWIWGFIASLFVMYSIASYMKLKNKVREAVRIRGGWECDRIETAFILGFIKPQIYIPMGMDRENRKHILSHERTHLDKGDHWIKMIGFLALALHWFNPLVWIAYILLCKDIEMACDERVIRFMELDERKAYSAALLSCSSRHARFIASPVAFGEVSVKQRILSILNYKKPNFWLSLVGVLAFFFVAICLLTSPEKPEQMPIVETLSPEEQAQQELLLKCHNDLETLFASDEFFYDAIGTNEKGSVLWQADLFKQGSNTMWKLNVSSRPDPVEGRMELDNRHYVWQSGNWIITDEPDTEYENWLALFQWDVESGHLLEEKQLEKNTDVVFTTNWSGADQTVHTSTTTYTYNTAGTLQRIRIDKPNHPTAEIVYLEVTPAIQLFGELKTVSDYFAEAASVIAEGSVTSEELATQAEFSDWGVHFRVDDDRLSSRGSDVYLSQNEHGRGSISTTDQYWFEKKVDSEWVTVPTITEPKWSADHVGIAKTLSTYGYLDWSPLYGSLEPGKYRMGKNFECYDSATGYHGTHVFYSEFYIVASVDSASPEAKAAVERCYSAFDELKKQDYLHIKKQMGWLEEIWIHNGNFLQIRDFGNENDNIPENNGRVDVTARWDGIGYSQVRENPEIRGSSIIGMQLSTLKADRAGWDVNAEESLEALFFDRNNKTASFPEGVGIISDEMVRFVLTWPVAGMEFDEASSQLTYKFDESGRLTYMEYKSLWDANRQSTFWVEIYDTSAEEIDAVIQPYTEDLIVGNFSWEEAKAKYTAAEFNIRENGFVNNSSNPITGPVEAARLALKEYPNLDQYLSLDISRDDTTGMWKITIESYVDYQSTYAFRDVYLSDSGVTQLLVYEGPIRFDEQRK